MLSFCRWAMHLPGPQKVFHRGHLFTRCAECDVTLIARGDGWTPVPPGKRVSWRPRGPGDRLFAVSTNSRRARLRFSLSAGLRAGLAALRRPRPVVAAGG